MPVALSHEVFGAGEPLVIVHGLFGSKRNWMSLAKRLGALANVIAVDLRNHGDSAHAPTMSFADMADDISALADELGHDRINIAGHSLGGKVAMMHALKHPGRTARLMVLDVAPVAYDSGFDSYVDAMQSVPLDRLTRRDEADPYLAEVITDPMVRMFLLHNLTRVNGRLRWRPNLAGIGANMAELAGFPALTDAYRYNGPARFLRADRSNYLLPEHESGIRRLFPAVELRTVDDAGHWIHSDQPDRIVEEIGALLKLPPHAST